MKRIKKTPVKTEKIVEVITESVEQVVDEDGGLISLLGKRVMFHCMNYNYLGVLSGVNTTDIELTDAQVVFETGAYTLKEPKYGEKLPSKLGLKVSAIEAYWEVAS